MEGRSAVCCPYMTWYQSIYSIGGWSWLYFRPAWKIVLYLGPVAVRLLQILLELLPPSTVVYNAQYSGHRERNEGILLSFK